MKLFLVFAILYTVGLNASNERGNGGFGFLRGINTVTVYDAYETTEIRKLEIKLGAENLTWPEKVQIAISRLDRINPNRAILYRTYLRTFFEDTQFLTTSKLPLSPDLGAISYPKDSILVQIAIQEKPLLPFDVRYKIDKTLWDGMNETNKAMLVLHEFIYREFIDDGTNPDSTKFVRYFNSLLVSDSFKEVRLKDYIELMHKLHFLRADVQMGIAIRIDCEQLSQCIQFRDMDTAGSIWFMDSNYYGSITFKDNTLKYFIPKRVPILNFRSNGEPENLYLIGPNKYSFFYKTNTININVANSEVNFGWQPSGLLWVSTEFGSTNDSQISYTDENGKRKICRVLIFNPETGAVDTCNL